MYRSKIVEINKLNYNVLSLKLEKPVNYSFKEGQLAYLSLNEETRRPFSIASTNSDTFLEFIIKIYEERKGFTFSLLSLSKNSSIFISDPLGSISFKDSGVFIAGGTGIVPFLSILRELKNKKSLKENTLIFSNKTEKDIFLKEELNNLQENSLNLIHTLTRESLPNYMNKRIDLTFLKENIKDFNQYFYICGPIRLVGETQHFLRILGADPDKIIMET
ncbi:MAG: flavodoxin reductase [Nanoarchaeota archaeon]